MQRNTGIGVRRGGSFPHTQKTLHSVYCAEMSGYAMMTQLRMNIEGGAQHGETL